MAWRASLCRSLISTARASGFRSSPSLSAPGRLRPPPLSAPRIQPRRFSFSNPRTLGELGCAQSLMPLHNVVAGTRLASQLSLNVRAFCELSHGYLRSGVLANGCIFNQLTLWELIKDNKLQFLYNPEWNPDKFV